MTQTQTETYRAALQEARTSFDSATKKLKDNERETALLKREIIRLRRTITALAVMCSENPAIDNLGITESCSHIMANTVWSMTTSDVVKALDEMGFEIEVQKNAPASVHAVLSRLAAKGVITKFNDEKNSNIVKWIGPKYDPTTEEEIPF